MIKCLISNMKGGSGKSTTAVNLAHSLSEYFKVALVDTDTQKTSSELAKNISVFNDIKSVPDDCEFIIIDTPPYISNELPKLCKDVDVVLVPVLPSFNDLLPTLKTIDILNQYRSKNSKIIVFINQDDKRSSLSNDIKEQLSKIPNILLMKASFCNRIAYKRSLPQDKGIFSLEDKKAKDEVDVFSKELISILLK